MALTGPPDGPAIGPPAPLVERLWRVGADLAERSARLGNRVELDPLRLLGERAAIGGLSRNGTISCGGATRLLPTADGWIAVSLARPDDVDLVPAWLGVEPVDGDPWAAVADAVGAVPAGPTVRGAVELGLPVAALPRDQPPRDQLTGDGTAASRDGAPARRTRVRTPGGAGVADLTGITVVDLSSLWAGPLCGSLLRQAGAAVWKVESTARPDGARLGPPAFFDLLNAGKRSVAVDFATSAGRGALRALVEHADVVIEASRPRALEQLGIDRAAVVGSGRGPRVWVSITAHGLGPGDRERVGFGDDAAVAGGLVVRNGDTPNFCADAVADPISGLVAATACLESLAGGGGWLVDVAMRDVAAHFAGPTLPVPVDVEVAAPTARQPMGVAPASGEHTADVLRRIGHAA